MLLAKVCRAHNEEKNLFIAPEPKNRNKNAKSTATASPTKYNAYIEPVTNYILSLNTENI